MKVLLNAETDGQTEKESLECANIREWQDILGELYLGVDISLG